MTPATALVELHAAGVRVRLGVDGTVLLHAAQRPPPAVLALARAHRDGIGAMLRERDGTRQPTTFQPPASPTCARGPWGEGVALLESLPPPDGITAERWAVLVSTSRRLLHDHGAALHRAGWDTLDLFGLHARAPAANPTGWGLAWLLGAAGMVVDVASEVVGMCREPDGARLAFPRGQASVQAGIVPAWEMRD